MHSTTYNFTYGAFDLRTGVKVGNQSLASYTYSNDRRYNLQKLDYGNGDSVQYEYDDEERLIKQTHIRNSRVDPVSLVAQVKDAGRMEGVKHLVKKLAPLIIVLGLFGCSAYPNEYVFENKNEPIESVELIYYPYARNMDKEDALLSIRFLEAEEIPEFMEKIYSLETKRVWSAPPRDWGVYIARVTYQNGDVEYLGSMHIEFVESGAEPIAQGIYCFSGDAFDKVFLEYAGNFDHLE